MKEQLRLHPRHFYVFIHSFFLSRSIFFICVIYRDLFHFFLSVCVTLMFERQWTVKTHLNLLNGAKNRDDGHIILALVGTTF